MGRRRRSANIHTTKHYIQANIYINHRERDIHIRDTNTHSHTYTHTHTHTHTHSQGPEAFCRRPEEG